MIDAPSSTTVPSDRVTDDTRLPCHVDLISPSPDDDDDDDDDAAVTATPASLLVEDIGDGSKISIVSILQSSS